MTCGFSKISQTAVVKVTRYNHVLCLAQYLARKEHSTNLTSVRDNIYFLHF